MKTSELGLSAMNRILKKAGAEYVILGHSENRHEGETNQLIKKKIASAFKKVESL